MNNILHISVSPRLHSITRRIGDHLVSRLKLVHPESTVQRHDLNRDPLPHLNRRTVEAMFTIPGDLDDALRHSLKRSDELIDELFAADFVVIEAPMFNWSVPSALKAWIDHVVRPGRTFMPPSPDRPYRGMLSDRPVYLIVASGGVYTTGASNHEDFLSPYLRHVLGFIGLRDLRFIYAEGALGSADQALEQGMAAADLVVLDADRTEA